MQAYQIFQYGFQFHLGLFLQKMHWNGHLEMARMCASFSMKTLFLTLFKVASPALCLWCAYFSILSTVFWCLWEAGPLQPVQLSSFLPSDPNWPCRDSGQQDTFRYPVKGFVIPLFLNEHNHWLAGWPAFPYPILPFFAGSHQQEVGGDLHSCFAGPPLLRKKRRLAGRKFPVRGMVTAQLIRALRRPSLAGHGSLKTLTSCCCPPLRNEDSTWPSGYHIPIYFFISI